MPPALGVRTSTYINFGWGEINIQTIARCQHTFGTGRRLEGLVLTLGEQRKLRCKFLEMGATESKSAPFTELPNSVPALETEQARPGPGTAEGRCKRLHKAPKGIRC